MTNIVFSSDDGFVEQLTVASSSVIYASRYANAIFTMYVLDCGISDEKWGGYEALMERLAERFCVSLKVVRKIIDMRQFNNVSSWTNGSKATWARILLPQILLSESTCIYSDCDMLFIKNPSEMIEELVQSGKAIIGHLNPFGDKSPDAKWFREKNLPFFAGDYFCAGLVAMNLDLMRQQNVCDACWEFLDKYLDPVSVDQTVLNFVCKNSRAILTEGWGLFTHECYREDIEIKAIHFSGGWPWKQAKNAYDALCIHLSKKAVEVWHSFQSNILGERDFVKPNASFSFRVKAVIVLCLCRMLSCVGLVPSRLVCLLELVKSYSGSSEQLEAIRDSFAKAAE